jgi:farnesyl diphosphate synthase
MSETHERMYLKRKRNPKFHGNHSFFLAFSQNEAATECGDFTDRFSSLAGQRVAISSKLRLRPRGKKEAEVAESSFERPWSATLSSESLSDPAPSQAALADAWAIATDGIESVLKALLAHPHGINARVQEAMRYAVFTGGKRLRPFLAVQCARLFEVPAYSAFRTGAAIEFVHTYSLIHDDLPCMDDDDLRRGRPTTHVKFDEATAVLAGDALLTFAFEVLASPETHPSTEVRCTLVRRLAEAGGSEGLVGGQMCDMLAPSNDFGIDDVVSLQRMKTGALFEFSCEAGAILGGAGNSARGRLRNYARDLGLAFQIADDLIDATGSPEKAGKAVGKDGVHGKATLLSHFGHEGARRQALMLTERAVEALSPFGKEADVLRRLPRYLLDRES